MKSEAGLAQLKAELIEVEAEFARRVAEMFTRARVTLNVAAEELREAEVRRERLKFHTEEEFAALLKISPDTLARERKAGRMPCVRIRGSLVRYTDEHLWIAAEVFAEPKTKKAQSHLREVAAAAS